MSLNKQQLVFFIASYLICHITAMFTASPDVICGRNMIKKAKIRGGEDAQEGEFPWLVSIRFEASKTEVHHVCGGALLNNRFVLTAAHCMLHKAFKYMSISAGEYDVKGRSSNEQIRKIQKVYIHEAFETKDYVNDIALLQLAEPVNWSSYVRPICLPDSKDDAGRSSLDSQMMLVAGWGSTVGNSNGEDKARFLQKAFVPIVDIHTCQKWYELGTAKSPGDPQHVNLLESSHLCAGYEQGLKDSCQGDSGGPLMKIDTTGRKVVVGVVSAGIGCGRPKTPGIYTRIVNYIPWIQSILSQNGLSLV